jgi:hypothetical protein
MLYTHLWDDAYGMVQYKNVMMQWRQILVDQARMCDTKYNIGMTRSNGNSPKIWARSSQGSKEKKSAIKDKFAQDLDRKLNRWKGSNGR